MVLVLYARTLVKKPSMVISTLHIIITMTISYTYIWVVKIMKWIIKITTVRLYTYITSRIRCTTGSSLENLTPLPPIVQPIIAPCTSTYSCALLSSCLLCIIWKFFFTITITTVRMIYLFLLHQLFYNQQSLISLNGKSQALLHWLY